MMEGLYGPQYFLYDNLPPPSPQMTVEVVGGGNYYHDNTAAFIPLPAASAFPYHPHGGHVIYGSSSAVSDSASSMAVTVAVTEAAEEEEEEGHVGVGMGIIRAKISSHPLYPKLLEAYIDCQKVGAPAQVARVLDKIRRSTAVLKVAASGADPELDEFMETYCDMLFKFKSDLSWPFEEATTFLKNIEDQLSHLCSHDSASSRNYTPDECGGGNSSEEEYLSGGEVEMECHQINEDRELMDKLMKKYSGYLGALKHEFSRKKKRGKLPKEARDALLEWWNLHYKWPYPTEADKVMLAQSTGLDPKQINNWFINQRKRHWKPSKNMQFSVMETIYGPFFHD